MQTFTGKMLDFRSPQIEDIDIIDIAHGLSNVCRFSGQSNHFYSVAEHSVLVSQLVPDEFKLDALLHDATEAYMGDIPSPLKQICFQYRNVETVLFTAIAKKFELISDMPRCVEEADLQMLACERLQVFTHKRKWGGFMDAMQPAQKTLFFFKPVNAMAYFLETYNELTKARHDALKT